MHSRLRKEGNKEYVIAEEKYKLET